MPIGRQFSTALSYVCMLCEQTQGLLFGPECFFKGGCKEIALEDEDNVSWSKNLGSLNSGMLSSNAPHWVCSCHPAHFTGLLGPSYAKCHSGNWYKTLILKSSYQHPWNYGSLIYQFKTKSQNLHIHKSNHMEESEVSQILFFYL